MLLIDHNKIQIIRDVHYSSFNKQICSAQFVLIPFLTRKEYKDMHSTNSTIAENLSTPHHTCDKESKNIQTQGI